MRPNPLTVFFITLLDKIIIMFIMVYKRYKNIMYQRYSFRNYLPIFSPVPTSSKKRHTI